MKSLVDHYFSHTKFFKNRFLNCVAPFIWFSRFSSSFPFRIQEVKENEYLLVISNCGFAQSLILNVVIFIYMVVNRETNVGGNPVMRFVTESKSILVSGCALANITSYLYNIKDIKRLHELALFHLSQDKKPKFRRKIFIFVTIQVLFCSSFGLVSYVSEWYYGGYTPLELFYLFLLYYVEYVYISIDYQFTNLILCFYKVHKQINYKLDSIIAEQINFWCVRTDVKTEKVHSVLDLYCDMLDACKLAENCFDIPLALCSLLTFLQSLASIYEYLDGLNFATFVTWFGYYSLNFWFIISCCEITAQEANRTRVLVHNLMAETKDPKLKEQLQEFSFQLLHRKIKFTACGLFPLNYALIYSIAGAVTTYLVILIQFDAATTNRVCAFTKDPP